MFLLFILKFKSLINLLFAYEPMERPSITEIRNHPWMTSETATDVEMQKEFGERKVIVSKKKALELAEEQRAKLNNKKNIVMCARGADEETDEDLEIFKDERKIEEYNP